MMRKNIVLVMGILCLVIAGTACEGLKDESKLKQETAVSKQAVPDNIPGDTLFLPFDKAQTPDSVKLAIKQEMKDILKDYAKRYKDRYFAGYFTTDLNGDSIPELWIKSGTHRENAKFELFYPGRDGKLRESVTPAEPGDYYLGDGYIIQIVGAGAGIKKMNRITIRYGEMDIENIREVNMAKNKETLPTPEEPKVKFKSLTDHSALNFFP